ncbi:MAG: Maf and M48 domain-containing protein [Candidatus Omnitrophota bacterium]
MTQIYLASNSRARRSLLKNLGLKFKILPTDIAERMKLPGLSYTALVKANALRKAQAALQSIKRGVVIAADTITVQEGKIYGKPVDYKAARRMLKKISLSPQYVYTGIAVIEKDKAIGKEKIMLDCEKTKVYMNRITDKEINAYFKRTSPLDKAGSFDIQGEGAFFIRRIEGCFYNVVGLPLSKLYTIFKKLNIKLLMFFLPVTCYLLSTFLLSGCSTEYNLVTGEQESYYYSTEKEVAMGKNIARQIEKEYNSTNIDPILEKKVKDIGARIAQVSDRKEIEYHFSVLDEDEVNAVSLPGGYIYIFKGLAEKVKSDDELAAVLAHEVAHVVARHSIKKLQAMTGYSILRFLMLPLPQGGQVGQAADLAFIEILTGYSREDELLADQLAARYAKLAGYNPRAMIDFLETLQDINRRRPLTPKNYIRTHPYVPDRIRVVKEELGEKIDFTDYINIEQKK